MLLQKTVRFSVYPPPHTFALQLCAGPLPCSALFVSGRECSGMRRSSWELTHWPWLLGFSACFCCSLQFQIARSKASLKDSLQPSPYPHNSSFKLCIACGATEASTRVASVITGLGSKRTLFGCEDKSSPESRTGSVGTGAAMLCYPFQIMTPDLFAVVKQCDIIFRAMPNTDLNSVRLLFTSLRL